MMWGLYHMGFGGWGLLFTAIVWIGVIALGVWLLARLFPRTGVTNSRRSGSSSTRSWPEQSAGDTAMQILQRRYARGELTKEEYETMRHDLAS